MPFVGAIPVPSPAGGNGSNATRRVDRRRLAAHDAETAEQIIREVDEAEITAPERSDQDANPRDPKGNTDEESHEDHEQQGLYGPKGKPGHPGAARHPKLDIKG